LHALQQENLVLQKTQDSPIQGMVTADPAMLKMCRSVERVAPADATVLLLGESGTGKELLARALHQMSPRASKKFVAINCAAIPENLLESELFGYEKGAFTGANKQTRGKIEFADFSSTRWAICRFPCKRKYCVSCKSAWWSASADERRSQWMCASCARPIKT
jgi:two-component system NtrC family response regulator